MNANRWNTIRGVLVGLVLLSTVVSAWSQTKRTLTDTQGRKIDATFLEASATELTFLRADGKVFTVPIASLSKEDQAFIAKWRGEQGSGADTEAGMNSPSAGDSGPAVTVVENRDPLVPPHGRAPVTRTFGSADGSGFLGTLTDFDGKKATFRSEAGAKFTVDLDKLAEEERVFVREWRFGSTGAERAWVWQVKPKYTYLSPFDEKGMAAVRMGKKGLVIDRKGETIVGPGYDFIGPFDSLDRARVGKDGLLGLIDREGNEVVPPKYDSLYGNSAFQIYSIRLEEKVGLIDASGKVLVEPSYDSIGRFNDEGIAATEKDEKRGLLHVSGKVLAEPEWEDLSGPLNDMIAVLREGQWGFLNSAGELVVSNVWDEVEGFSPGGYAKVKRGGRTALMHKSGVEVLRPEWDAVIWDDEKEEGVVRRGESWSQFDSKGAIGRTVGVDQVPANRPIRSSSSSGYVRYRGWDADTGRSNYTPQYSEDGLAVVYRTGPESGSREWAFIDRQRKVVLPFSDREPRPFQDDYAAFRKGGKWGLMNREGDTVIEAAYQDLGAYQEGLIPFKFGGSWGFMDLEENIALQASWEKAEAFSEGLAKVGHEKKFGFINRQGEWVVAPEWSDAGRFRGGLAAVKFPDEQKWGYIDAKGRTVLEPRWELAEPFYGGMAAVAEDAEPIQYLPSYLGNSSQRPPKSRELIDREGNPLLEIRVTEFSRGRNRVEDSHFEPSISDTAYPIQLFDPDSGFRRARLPLSGELLGEEFVLTTPRRRGLIDTSGKVLVPPRWDDVRILSNERVLFQVGGKWGLADREGKVIAEATWDDAGTGSVNYLSKDPVHVKKDGKNGFVYRNSGVVIAPFYEGDLVRYWGSKLIRKDGKFGIVGGAGEIMAAPTLESVPEPFRSKPFWEEEKYGFVDSAGAVVIEPTWDEAKHLYGPWYVLSRAEVEFIVVGADGKSVIPESMPDADYVDFYIDRGVVLKTTSEAGQEVWHLWMPAEDSLVTYEGAEKVYWNRVCGRMGLMWAKPYDSTLWKLYDDQGKELGFALPSVPDAWRFNGGRVAVTTKGDDWFFLDTDLKRIGKGSWEEVRPFREGLAAVRRGNKWGFLKPDGTVAIEPRWAEVRDFQSSRQFEMAEGKLPEFAGGLAAVREGEGADGKWGFIDRLGRFLIEPRYSAADLSGSKVNLSQAIRDSLWATYSLEATTDIYPISPDRAWIQSSKDRDHWAMVNGAGEALTEFAWGKPRSQVRPDKFADGLITARSPEGRMGFLDRSGKVVVESEFTSIDWVAPGVAAVWGQQTGLIDSSGNWIYEATDEISIPRFRRARYREETPEVFRQGLVVIEEVPKLGVARFSLRASQEAAAPEESSEQ